MQMSPVLGYTDVDHCALMCLNDLHQIPKVFLNVESQCKTILFEMRKIFSCCALSDGIIPIDGANVSDRLRCFHPSIELKENNMSEMFQFLHLALHFLVCTALLTIFKWQNFHM